MPARLPISLKRPGGFAIRCGRDEAILCIYTQKERVAQELFNAAEREEIAKDVARALGSVDRTKEA